jgi:cyclopropane-fatty-acyl-phospholipid synthase
VPDRKVFATGKTRRGSMDVSRPAKADPAASFCLEFLQGLFRDYRSANFSVRLWDGSTWAAAPGAPPDFTLVFRHPGSVRRMFLAPGELSFAEAFVFGDVDVEGDLEAALSLGDHLIGLRWGIAERLRVLRVLAALPSSKRARSGRGAARLDGPLHSTDRDRAAISYHYDLSNDFYSLWLDRRMVYSCAYFAAPGDGLDAAQAAKLDLICRKLGLAPGERFLDIGCGWGGLIIHAASAYGVQATGITLSREQAALARERIERAGISGSCRVELADYREAGEAGGFDKIASVGMFEHVGESRLPEYFERVRTLLRPGGVFLNHGIATNPNRGPSFVDRYIFPDGDLVPVSAALCAAEGAGFEVRDLESLREHYALTLRHWVRRLEARMDEAVRAAGETACRAWRLYMAGAARYFDLGLISVYQALLAKPAEGRSGLPLTRAHWYERKAA